MYASTEKALEDSVGDILKKVNYPKFIKRFNFFLKKKKKKVCVLLYRQNLPRRKCNTNNYAEATIRILKDVVLAKQNHLML